MNLGTILRAILIGTAAKGWAESDKDTRKKTLRIVLTVSGWFFLVVGVMGGLWGPPNNHDWFWYAIMGGALVIWTRRRTKQVAETESCDGSTRIQSTSPTKTNGAQKSG